MLSRRLRSSSEYPRSVAPAGIGSTATKLRSRSAGMVQVRRVHAQQPARAGQRVQPELQAVRVPPARLTRAVTALAGR